MTINEIVTQQSDILNLVQ